MPSRARSRRELVRVLGAAAVCTCIGCEAQFNPGASTIQEMLVAPGSTPSEQAAMAVNTYDANQRYLGTLRLANQSFAGAPVYIRLFETNITDSDPMVRAAAIRGLANHGEPKHAEVIAVRLRDENPMVRVEAARGLQRLHNEAVIDALLMALREPDPTSRGIASEPESDVRAEAATALGQYAQKKVLRALIVALDDLDLSVNRAAQRSLRTLTSQDFGIDRPAWQAWADKTEEPFAGRTLYMYPAYSREQRFYEYIPLVPKPPNEVAAPPTGLPR